MTDKPIDKPKRSRAATDSREALMVKHRAARAQRDAAPLGSDEFRDAAEDVARIEIAIAKIEEPPADAPRSASR